MVTGGHGVSGGVRSGGHSNGKALKFITQLLSTGIKHTAV